MRNIVKFVLILIVSFSLATYNIYLAYNERLPEHEKEYIEKDDSLIDEINEFKNKTLNFKRNCNPFIENERNFRIKIDDVVYPKYIPLRDNKKINFSCLNEATKPKVILYWTNFYEKEDFYYGLGRFTPFLKHKCPVYNCELTNDKQRINESDLVVFSILDTPPINNTMPLYRTQAQYWLLLLIESPFNIENNKFRDYFYGYDEDDFNLSMTYRSDSDFVSHYALESKIVWQKNFNYDENFDFSMNKSGFAAILISNCYAESSGRNAYVRELKKYVPVSVYGACGEPCPNKFQNGTEGDCREIITSKYKFFLAFENSLCKDYLTEKFFLTLQYNIIPVVLGMGNYHDYIPKSGYINVNDYDSPKSLAKYLKYLDKNKTAYNSYFKWKRYVIIRNYTEPHASEICEFCIRLNLERYTGVKKKIIKNLQQFWQQKIDCQTGVMNY